MELLRRVVLQYKHFWKCSSTSFQTLRCSSQFQDSHHSHNVHIMFVWMRKKLERLLM